MLCEAAACQTARYVSIAACRLYTSGRDLEEISPTLAHDLLAVLTRIQPAKMT